jgi:hypothetical protein
LYAGTRREQPLYIGESRSPPLPGAPGRRNPQWRAQRIPFPVRGVASHVAVNATGDGLTASGSAADASSQGAPHRTVRYNETPLRRDAAKGERAPRAVNPLNPRDVRTGAARRSGACLGPRQYGCNCVTSRSQGLPLHPKGGPPAPSVRSRCRGFEGLPDLEGNRPPPTELLGANPIGRRFEGWLGGRVSKPPPAEHERGTSWALHIGTHARPAEGLGALDSWPSS